MGQAVPVFAPKPLQIRSIDLDRPWAWLARGWQDMRRNPGVSLAYGVVAAVTSYLLTLGLIWADMLYLLLPLAGGFLLVGPILTVGLYEVSRRAEEGLPTGLGEAILAFRRNTLQIALMGVVLLLLWFFWVRTAALLFFLYFGLEPPSVENLIVETFFTADALPFLVIGTAVGALFAFVAYSISVISVPLLLDRPEASIIEAVAASVRAVQSNFVAMLLWAMLIVVFIAFGLVTLYLGLVITLPLVGHASWHAYRDLVLSGEGAG